MEFITDPQGHYADNGVDESRITGAMGVLPLWAMEAALQGKEPMQYMQDRYGFGPLIEMRGGEVDSCGNYTYPEDPELRPLAVLCWEWGNIYFHQYGMIVLDKGGKQEEIFVARMD